MIVNEEIPEDMFEVTDEIQAFLTAQQRIHDRQKRK
jgi:type III secretion system FlhB-like substrate exporter